MFKLLRKKIGFSIVEVIVAAVIFALAAAGIFATISALTQPAEESSQDVTAAFLGKQVLEDLRRSVNGESWNTGGDLSVGTHPLSGQTIDGVTYSVAYTVSADPDTDGRFVTLNITW